ncbi:MAG: ribonuclease HI [Pseudohongiella sp.]|nr:ribonuclease HI [Pseudohongiella sp.]MDO9519779.1 ribonuclease HI [Pseudohongiella sp.]MDP2126255.1 ribonuclease HI [Pseudohongiella sp.]
MSETIEIYTDGACKGNPGKGGWGALLRYRDVVRELYGAEQLTTNNRMELTAVIKALEALKRPGLSVRLFSDSRYVLSGIEEWMPAWKARGWKTSSRKPVLNQDLWQRLDELSQQHKIEWRWVKGHSGDIGNEKADELANRAIEEMN